jgi:hypothetical protein
MFWDMTPCSPSFNRGACHLIFAELISSALKMEAICSSETSVETGRTARRHNPEDDTLHNHRGENLKSYKVKRRLNRRILSLSVIEHHKE